jgi:hypothetical protein
MQIIVDFLKDLSLYGMEKMGLYYSRYRGFVYSNQDPDGYGRLQVNVPEVYGDGVIKTWAWPASNFAGNGYGAQCLPQKNDLIWVSFEKGNPRKPIWHYGYFTKGAKPDDLKDTSLFWFRTPKGLTILVDDKNGTITLFKKDGTIEPMLLGNQWETLMKNLTDILRKGKINTQLGPQGFLPNTLQELIDLDTKWKDAFSKVNKLS